MPFNGEIEIFHASAGTAKTTQLINKVQEAIAAGTPPERVAFVSFTRAAAEVARERTSQKLNIPKNRLPNFRTIHSLAFRGVKANKEAMMTEERYTKFGDEIGMRLHNVMTTNTEGLDWDDIKDRNIVSLEQLYRNNRKMYEMLASDRVDSRRLISYMSFYHRFKMDNNYMDFTDLLEKYIEEGHIEDVDVVCLDEMQDSSMLQWRVVLQAFQNAKKIYIAADAKQQIYSFQGGDSRIMMNMRGKHNVLDLSYRVPSNIMTFANDIAKLIDTPYNEPCKSYLEGGSVDYLNDVDELDLSFQKDKTYFMIARGQCERRHFVEYCETRGINYIKDGEPRLTEHDYFEFQNNRIDLWTEEKKHFAAACIRNKTWPGKVNVNIGTIHSTKGNEADVVVVMSDVPRLVYKIMQEEIGEDNEHRVFYVAVTRAKEKLLIVNPQTKMYYPFIL